MSNHIIDLTVDSEDDECDFYHINPILVETRVASPIRWSPVFMDIAECEAAIFPAKRKASEELLDLTPPIKTPKKFNCVPSIIRNPSPSVPSAAVKKIPIFIPNPERFYCHCYKTHVNHTHEKRLAARGLSGEDKLVYLSCGIRARGLNEVCSSNDQPIGCIFFTRSLKPDINKY